jgi:type IV pilus assembly protein PilN
MIRINLLPVRAEKKKDALRQHALFAVGMLSILGAVIAGVHLALGSQVSDFERRIGERKAEIARLQAVIGEVREFKSKKKALEEKISVIAGLEQRQHGPAQVLYELAKLVPEKLWVESWKDAGGALSLEGVAIDNQTIAQFMTAMQASPWFSGIRLEVTRQATRGGADLKSFSIKASVTYAKAG